MLDLRSVGQVRSSDPQTGSLFGLLLNTGIQVGPGVDGGPREPQLWVCFLGGRVWVVQAGPMASRLSPSHGLGLWPRPLDSQLLSE